MFKVFGYVIQKESERKEDFVDLHNQISRLLRMNIDYEKSISGKDLHIAGLKNEVQNLDRLTDTCLETIAKKDAEIITLETIIQRYKEKMRERNKEHS